MKHSANFKDMTGQKFERLRVLEFAGRQGVHALWRCICDCGTERIVAGTNLREGRTLSCGCYLRDLKPHFVHGHAGSSTTYEYRAWTRMKRRCNNRHDISWKDYGGRGIKVCARWQSSFENFLKDMGRAPLGMTIDRIENDGDYEPGNCKWSTPKEQAWNKRSTVRKTISGVTKTLPEWAATVGISTHQLRSRLHRGWNISRSLSQPIRHQTNA